MGKGYIYLIKAEGMDVYKIGVADVADVRLKTLQAGSPVKLELLRSVWCDDASAAERALHEAFAHQRLHNEWFRLDSAAMSEIYRTLDGIESGGYEASVRQLTESAKHQRAMTLFLDGKSNKEVVELVWGVKATAGIPYVKASREWYDVQRAYARSLRKG